ncbi:MAG: ATP-dependent DNA helicase [Caldithrix sp.]|nr:MAG: ATP-dependent DNA helicase [Caldithrix sp.]
MVEKNRLSVSVRDLVEFSLRSGDLEYASMGPSNSLTAIRIHQKIQKGRPEGYQNEVPISRTYDTESCTLEVNGRIDGIFESSGQTTIDEIKTTVGDLEIVSTRPNACHWGQAKTYACFYAFQNKLAGIGVQLTYFHLLSKEVKEIRKSFSLTELEEFVGQLVSKYLEWTEKIVRWIELRNESISNLTFPFKTYRTGQREMAATVYKAIGNQSQTLIQAPTGIGKTMAALFSAIKAQGNGSMQKLFYLTARTTGKGAPEEALNTLRDHGLALKSLTITAKDKICFNPEKACHADECEYARGFYDRLNEALVEAFTHDRFTCDLMSELSQKHQLCPFAFSLELANYVDCIICDYNYVFDPRVYLRRFFAEGKKNSVLLVDEAHNLIDRSRDMYSAELNKSTVLEVRRLVRDKQRHLYKILAHLNGLFVKIRKKCEPAHGRFVEAQLNPELKLSVGKIVYTMQAYLTQNTLGDNCQAVLDFYFSLTNFLAVMERYDENYTTIYERVGKDIRVKLFCLKPAKEVRKRLQQTISTSFLSATLTPTGYFKELLGCDDAVQEVHLQSPFPSENLQTLIASHISTRFHDRQKTKRELCTLLSSFVQHRRGNYILFFPSYAYLNMVYDLFGHPGFEIKTIVQKPHLSEEDRSHFLNHFSAQHEKGLVGFAVMGGIFGEGIDLVGEKLSGVAIIGVGLPGLSFERDLIRNAFDTPFRRGYEYAYQYPGINRVLQAAGRVIRTENDKGVVLLVDDRFNNRSYRSLLPSYWQPKLIRDEEDLNSNLTAFWNMVTKDSANGNGSISI